MANKKIVMSVAASAAIAATIYSAEDAEASSYKVKSGDTLWSIAQQFDMNVGQLKSVNDLSNNTIYPSQVLETNDNSSSESDVSTQSVNSSQAAKGSSEKHTYTVKSGDTLSGIASKHNISVEELKKWNHLNSSLIHPGDTFTVSRNGSNDSNASKSESTSSSNKTSSSGGSSSSPDTYTVQSGDTLSSIARDYNVPVRKLKNWNNLSSDLILIGQKLSIGADASSHDSPNKTQTDSNKGQATAGSSVDTDYDVDQLLSTAQNLKGTPYVWGGSTTSGFDCSGFIQYTFNQAGKDLSRLSSAGYYNRAQYVNNPQPGDLVFFENTYAGANGISHMGIYLGGGDFIHAGSDGVAISNVNSNYWQQYFDGYKRFY